MEATPKVHRHRHHRSDSRQRRQERQIQQAGNLPEQTAQIAFVMQDRTDNGLQDTVPAEEGCFSSIMTVAAEPAVRSETTTIRLAQEHTGQSDAADESAETVATPLSQESQQTVVLVNGHAPPPDMQDEPMSTTIDVTVSESKTEDSIGTTLPAPHLESPTQQQAAGSSRNSSGDALSLRETLQQLPSSVTTVHRHRRSAHSPQTHEVDSSFHRGILGFMDRELKQSSPTPSALSAGGTARKLQSLSDPQASPAQRSTRSRSSLEKSPRRKRSKSESRRRRERKLIAAGEMEVRQANETLMRYLKQCSEMNDASLSGELEIDQNYDERRVHRKTKSQRDKRGHLISKLYSAGGLTSILKELTDDIVPADGEEIYNPFTPVVSPTDETPAHIDKMFLQTSSGYRPVEHCCYKYSFVGTHGAGRDGGVGGGEGRIVGGSRRGIGSYTASIDGCSTEGRNGGNIISCNCRGAASVGGLRGSSGYVDTHCLLDATGYERHEITTNIQLACILQRVWVLVSNICHGLLAGLALAHLLFVLSSHPMDWSILISNIGQAGQSAKKVNESVATTTINPAPAQPFTDEQSSVIIKDYAAFADIYLNSFYCLAILCLVSVLDRMDICSWQFSSTAETISFRWLVIAMIYIATIILTICSNTIDEKLYYYNNANVILTQEEMLSKSVSSVWSSLAVTRSIGAICGWFMISLAPNEDLLYGHLIDLTRHQVAN